MSFKYEVIADNSGQWCSNGVRFATREEAESAAYSKMMAWTLVRDTRVVESDEPVNYEWTTTGLVPVNASVGV